MRMGGVAKRGGFLGVNDSERGVLGAECGVELLLLLLEFVAGLNCKLAKPLMTPHGISDWLNVPW